MRVSPATSPSRRGFHFTNKLPPRQCPASHCFIAAHPGLCTQPQLLGHVGLMHSTSFTWQLEGSPAHEQRVHRNIEPEDWLMGASPHCRWTSPTQARVALLLAPPHQSHFTSELMAPQRLRHFTQEPSLVSPIALPRDKSATDSPH
jgi:hypothetical protein